MKLTSVQLSAFATHMKANTNLTPATDANGNALPTPFQINTFANLTVGQAGFRDPTLQGCVAAWYNQAAFAGDQQAFANLLVWNPVTTIDQIDSAATYTLASVEQGGSPTDTQATNLILLWQIFIWKLGATTNPPSGVDLGDAGNRKTVLNVWGDVTTGVANAKAILGPGCGQQTGRNIELLLSNAVTTVSAGGASTPAHPIQKDFNGKTIYGQIVLATDVDFTLFPNG